MADSEPQSSFIQHVFIFHGSGAKFAAGVYDGLDAAKRNIAAHKMSGLLTKYSLNETAFDYAIRNKLFEPKEEKPAHFVQRFTSAAQDHFHFENGEMSG